MKRTLRKTILIFCISFIPSALYSQAVRVNYYGLNTMQEESRSIRHQFIGIGYEKNLFDKIAVSLEFNTGYNLNQFANVEPNGGNFLLIDNSGNYYYYSYLLNIGWREFAYQSKYFFRKNTDNSFYLATGISLIAMGYEMDIVDVDDPGNNGGTGPLSLGKIEHTNIFFPVSFKFGFRNNITGIFGDYSCGISFLPSSGAYGTGNPKIDAADGTASFNQLKSVYFMVAMSLGFGWYKD
jgi:hypothetical protein